MNTSNKLIFDQQFVCGSQGEHIVSNLLIRRGFVVMPYYQFSGSTTIPRVYYGTSSFNAPDLQATHLGKPYWFEVKLKNRWVKYGNNIETGVDANDFDYYTQVQNFSSSSVCIAFIHIQMEPRGIYMANISKPTRYWDGKVKGKTTYDLHGHANTPKRFWNIEQLKPWPLLDSEFVELTKNLQL